MADRASATQIATVIQNDRLCAEHYRISLRVSSLLDARPGRFVLIGPPREAPIDKAPADDLEVAQYRPRGCDTAPLLRRAFSIAGLRRTADGVFADLIYRVVGTGTQWMRSLKPGDPVSILGPCGNEFPIHPRKPHAWLVAGGVGLPPMLWLAETLRAADKRVIAFCGAQRGDLLPLTLDKDAPPAAGATHATPSASEFAQHDVEVVLSTDDGSLGFHGHVGGALEVYHGQNTTDADELVVYTCGPDRMMRFVSRYCMARGIECYVCMERAMACGHGTCQSCVVPVHDANDPDGWRYELCCSDGPVFDATRIVWEPSGA